MWFVGLMPFKWLSFALVDDAEVLEAVGNIFPLTSLGEGYGLLPQYSFRNLRRQNSGHYFSSRRISWLNSIRFLLL
jgi:hypothetical protein